MIAITVFVLEIIIKIFLNSIGLRQRTVVDVFFILAFSIALFFDLSSFKKIKELAVPLLCGYLFRVFLLFFDRYGRNILTLPNSNSDSEGFYYNSIQYAFGDASRMGTFPKVMGTIFKFIGISRLFGQFIILLFSLVSLIILALIISDIDVHQVNKKTAMYIIALIPNSAILSIVFMRESLITMLISLSIYMYYKWFRTGNSLAFVLAFAFALIASIFHGGSSAIAIGYIAIFFFYDRKTGEFSFRLKRVAPCLILLLVICYLFVNYGATFFSKFQSVNDISDIANMHENGGSSYARYVGNSNNPISMIVFTPLRIVFFLFSPFPWQFRGINDIIAFVFSSMFYIFVSYYDISYLRAKNKKNNLLIISLSIIIACTVFVFSWGVANTGTACRHRDKIIVIWGVLLALVYKPRKSDKYEEKGVSHE